MSILEVIARPGRGAPRTGGRLHARPPRGRHVFGHAAEILVVEHLEGEARMILQAPLNRSSSPSNSRPRMPRAQRKMAPTRLSTRMNALDERVDLRGDLRALPGSPKLATAPGFRAGCNSLHARPRPGRCGSFLPHPACRDARLLHRPRPEHCLPALRKSRRLKFHLPASMQDTGMSIASPSRMMMLALTIRFCFPPTSSSRPGSGRLAADVFSPQKRVPNRPRSPR